MSVCSSPYPFLLQTTDLLPVTMALPFLGFHMYGILRCKALGSGFFHLTYPFTLSMLFDAPLHSRPQHRAVYEASLHPMPSTGAGLRGDINVE